MTATSGAIRAGRKVLAPAHGMDVAEVIGAKRDVLLARVEEFLAGKAPAHSEFELGDFRDEDHRTVLMVEESC
jgi:hypothetical protein